MKEYTINMRSESEKIEEFLVRIDRQAPGFVKSYKRGNKLFLKPTLGKPEEISYFYKELKYNYGFTLGKEVHWGNGHWYPKHAWVLL